MPLLRRRSSFLSPRFPPGRSHERRRVFRRERTPEQVVARIIREVRRKGDAALLKFTSLLDGVQINKLELDKEAIERAYREADPILRNSLEFAAHRIRCYHQARKAEVMSSSQGLQQEIQRPLDRVGLYIPGGTASYPSTVLMTAIPAKVAGVKEIVVACPPTRDGHPPPAVLVAACIAQVDRVFNVGGVQAIAALALGTESVPRVDKVCGPGNILVTLAKKQLYGTVGIDGLYGPTETVLIADETADPRLCAADLLAQAEHDVLASPLLITISEELAIAVQRELRLQLKRLERRAIAGPALRRQGGIIVVETIEEAIELANLYAPEHLCLVVKKPYEHLASVQHAGCVFLGQGMPEVVGDYVAGPSHVLPTGGTARFASGLGVGDFLQRISVLHPQEVDLPQLLASAAVLARAEGLTAHAHAAELRLELESRSARP